MNDALLSEYIRYTEHKSDPRILSTNNNGNGTITVKFEHYWSNISWEKDETTIELLDLIGFVFNNK